MIVISLHRGRPWHTGVYGDSVLLFFTADAHSGQLCGHGGYAVALLKADMAYMGDGSGGIREGGYGSKGDSLIGAGGHVGPDSMDAAVSGRHYKDALRRIFGGAAHLFQKMQEGRIPLKGVEMHMVHQNRYVQKGAHGIKVAGGRNIRLYQVVSGLIGLSGPGAEGAGGCPLNPDAELFHHPQCHLDIGHTVAALNPCDEIPAA